MGGRAWGRRQAWTFGAEGGSGRLRAQTLAAIAAGGGPIGPGAARGVAMTRTNGLGIGRGQHISIGPMGEAPGVATVAGATGPAWSVDSSLPVRGGAAVAADGWESSVWTGGGEAPFSASLLLSCVTIRDRTPSRGVGHVTLCALPCFVARRELGLAARSSRSACARSSWSSGHHRSDIGTGRLDLSTRPPGRIAHQWNRGSTPSCAASSFAMGTRPFSPVCAGVGVAGLWRAGGRWEIAAGHCHLTPDISGRRREISC